MPSFLAPLQNELRLPRAIHFTTINKFALRIKQTYLEVIITKMLKSNESSLVAIDGIGFSLNTRSQYFCTIAGPKNQFLQTNVAAEVKRRLIIAVRLRGKRRNKNIDVPYLMEQSSKQLPITAFSADKQFDSEKNHEIAEEHGTKLISPIRDKTNKYHRVRRVH